ncbi:7719_t:CDS:1, partial [Funneliformis geosporum]
MSDKIEATNRIIETKIEELEASNTEEENSEGSGDEEATPPKKPPAELNKELAEKLISTINSLTSLAKLKEQTQA